MAVFCGNNMIEKRNGKNIFDEEVLRFIQDGNDTINRHYSDKGGHFLRGRFSKIQEKLQRHLPGFYYRNISDLINIEDDNGRR